MIAAFPELPEQERKLASWLQSAMRAGSVSGGRSFWGWNRSDFRDIGWQLLVANWECECGPTLGYVDSNQKTAVSDRVLEAFLPRRSEAESGQGSYIYAIQSRCQVEVTLWMPKSHICRPRVPLTIIIEC